MFFVDYFSEAHNQDTLLYEWNNSERVGKMPAWLSNIAWYELTVKIKIHHPEDFSYFNIIG